MVLKCLIWERSLLQLVFFTKMSFFSRPNWFAEMRKIWIKTLERSWWTIWNCLFPGKYFFSNGRLKVTFLPTSRRWKSEKFFKQQMMYIKCLFLELYMLRWIRGTIWAFWSSTNISYHVWPQISADDSINFKISQKDSSLDLSWLKERLMM